MAALSFRRYVDIESGVIGAGGTRERELIGRLFTDNQRMDSDEVLEFDDIVDVGNRFGADSEEYRRARFYLGWVSPNITRPSKISFARYVPQEEPVRIYGSRAASLSSIQALGSDNSITLTIGGTAYYVQGIDFTQDVSTYADVATVLQNAIRQSSEDSVITDATVTFISTDTSFRFTGGLAGNVDIASDSGPTTQAIGWTASSGALLLAGHVQQTPSEAITSADGITNNYASCEFVPDLDIDSHVEAAQTLNSIESVGYMYCVPVTLDNWQQWQDRLKAIPGVAMTIVGDVRTENYGEMIPMIQAASINYNNRNATQTYMYREFDVPVTVTDNTVANNLNAARVNYYGQTQEAGVKFAFYQKGYLQGPNTAPLDQSVFVNEIWLKSRARVEFMDLLRALPELPANETGRAYGFNTLQAIVDAALYNGVISIGKALTNTQKVAIGQLSGDENAWRQVQSIGYWMNVNIESFANESGATEYRLTYLLIYSKKDAVRSVQGRHALV